MVVVEGKDGIPLFRDIDLGEWLGRKEAQAIRNLVQHLAESLVAFGVVETQRLDVLMPSGRFKQTDRYYLSRNQAVYITSLAGTPKARGIDGVRGEGLVCLPERKAGGL